MAPPVIRLPLLSARGGAACMLNDDAQNPAGEPSAYQLLTVERRGLAAWVTLNRPEVHNAFNALLIAELHDAFTRLSAADDIRAVVLMGAGRSFCAGADLNWMRASLDFTHEQNVADALRMADMFRAIDSCRHTQGVGHVL